MHAMRLALLWGLILGAFPCRAALQMSAYTTAGVGVYTQNFNTLPTTGQRLWANDVSLSGWHAYNYFPVPSTRVTNYASAGSISQVGVLYSYGSTDSTDRAMGSQSPRITYGVQFLNDGANAADILLEFTGEQWRRGGNSPQVSDTLSVWYRVANAEMTGLAAWTGGWTQISALLFNAPNISATTALALDGNVASNRVFLSAAVPGLTVASGEYVAFRWRDDDNPGSQEHGLALDDLRIQWTEVPEPASSALGLVALLLLRRRREKGSDEKRGQALILSIRQRCDVPLCARH